MTRSNSSSAAIAEPRHTDWSRGHGLLRLLMLVTTFFWAGNIIAGKIVLRSISPLALAQCRVTGAAVGFACLFLGRRSRPRLMGLQPDWGSLSLIAIFGITLNQLFFLDGVGRTSATHAGLIVALGPVMVLVLASFMGLETFTLMKSIGTAVAFGGVAVLAAHRGVSSGGASLLGDGIMMGGTIVFAYYTVLLKRVARSYDALTLNAATFCLGAVFMVPFTLSATLRVRWNQLPPEAWCGMAFMVVFGTVVSYLIYAFALTGLSAARVAAFAYLQPIIAIALAVRMLRERLNLAVVIGGILILLGVYLAEKETPSSVNC